MAFSQLGRTLDVEWFLSLDESRTDAELTQEASTVSSPAGTPRDTFERWLAMRREGVGNRSLGVRVSEGLSAVHALLIVVSFLLGSSTAEALLFASDPQSPTNVLAFLSATLVWPLVLLVGTLVMLLVRRRIRAPALLTEGYTWAVSWVLRLRRRAPGSEPSLVSQWRALRRRANRYRDIESLSLARASQAYALCFHLGAALSLLRSAVFSDLTFAWSTTDGALSYQTLASVFGAVSAPWCASSGFACVSTELVRTTEFVNFSRSYVHPTGASTSGAWWTPIWMCLLVYGVLPRLLLWGFLGHLLSRRSKDLPDRVLELRRRLHGGLSVQAIPFSKQPDGAQPSPGLAPAMPAPGSEREPSQLVPCWLILWRDAQPPARADGYAKEFGFAISRTDQAGGRDFQKDEALVERLGDDPQMPILLLAEGWEAPDKATRRFLKSIRQRSDRKRPLFVAVLGSSDGEVPDVGVWRDRLGMLEDPYLSVERFSDRSASGSQKRDLREVGG